MNKRTPLIFIVFALACLCTASSAQDDRYAAAFLELGIGARGLGLGDAYVAVADDGSAFYWNPAGASTLLRAEVSGMYASLFKSLVRHTHLGFTRPLYGAGSISVNWIRLSVADIPNYDSQYLDLTYSERVGDATGSDPTGEWSVFNSVLTQDPIGFSSAHDDALIITLSKLNQIDVDFGWQYFVMPINIPIGMNVKLIRQSLFDNSASGVGFDFGSMLKFGIDDLFDDSRLGKLAFGLAVKDAFNTKITWDTASRHADRIKRSWHMGASYLQPMQKISGQLLLSYAFLSKYEQAHNLGIEYTYYERLAVRFGLSDSRFTAGVGLNVALFRVDYAYRSHELGGSHRINTAIQL